MEKNNLQSLSINTKANKTIIVTALSVNTKARGKYCFL